MPNTGSKFCKERFRTIIIIIIVIIVIIIIIIIIITTGGNSLLIAEYNLKELIETSY